MNDPRDTNFPGTRLARPASLSELFMAFTLLALQGFGGVLAVSQRMLCDEKRWFSPVQYVEVLAIAQVLPGPNVCNLALLVGNRFFGWRGALAALGGMMMVPLFVVLALTVVYAQLASLLAVAGALRGMSAVSAGLVIGTALRLTETLRGNAMRKPACVLFGGAAFIAIALLRWPLVWVLLGVGLIACLFAWYRGGDSVRLQSGEASR
jgi:chromate transporter